MCPIMRRAWMTACIAATGRRKAFHFISTLGTAMSRDAQGWMVEVDPHDSPVATDGYDLGKWVCEKCLEQAARNGMDVNIFRPGNITGESETGFCRPETNHLLLLLKGCVQMKAAPDWPSGIEFTPVDVLAKGIVRLSLASGGFNIFNMHNPRQLSWREYLDSARRAGVNVVLSKSFGLAGKFSPAVLPPPVPFCCVAANTEGK